MSSFIHIGFKEILSIKNNHSISIAVDSFKLFVVINFGLSYGYSFSVCVGPSMLPTICEKGDVVFIDHISFTFFEKNYNGGDVVICTSPHDRYNALSS
jgi:signal peptidase I